MKIQITEIHASHGIVRMAEHGLPVGGARRRAMPGRKGQRGEFVEGVEVSGITAQDLDIGLLGRLILARRCEATRPCEQLLNERIRTRHHPIMVA